MKTLIKKILTETTNKFNNVKTRWLIEKVLTITVISLFFIMSVFSACVLEYMGDFEKDFDIFLLSTQFILIVSSISAFVWIIFELKEKYKNFLVQHLSRKEKELIKIKDEIEKMKIELDKF